MTSFASGGEERLSDATREALRGLSAAAQDQVRECIEYLRDKPEPDGQIIFDDTSMIPIMMRTMVCGDFAITFQMINRQARIYAIVQI